MYKYVHGGAAAFEPGGRIRFDLSANINPLGFPDGVTEAVLSGAESWRTYPDSFSTALREKIAEAEGVAPDRIFCGNGASDILFRLAPGCKAKKALIPVPSFSEYERSARVGGAEIAFHALAEETGFAVDHSLLAAIEREKPDLFYLCNPNNPTGVLTERGLIETALERAAETNTLFIIDECFMDFVEGAEAYTAKPLLKRFPNLVILKAFTKTFALPGLRLGYALAGSAAVVDSLYACGPDWPVSAAAQAAGIAALRSADVFLKKTAGYIAEENAKMRTALADNGFSIFGSCANYIFFKSPYSFDLCARLDEKGIRIRDCGNFRGLPQGYYRAAVSTREANATFITAIKEVIHCQARS